MLQRDVPLPIWGKASPGSEIIVRFRNQSKTTKTDAAGNWHVALQAEPAGGPDTLFINNEATKLELKDILVGEVWLASGQSNMAFKLQGMGNKQPPQISNDNHLRFFLVEQNPQDHPSETASGEWQNASPETSAIAYFFATNLKSQLKVPVGVIVSAIGGTFVQSWTSQEAAGRAPEAEHAFTDAWQKVLGAYPGAFEKYEKALVKWSEKKKTAEMEGRPFLEKQPIPPPGPQSPKRPHCLWNGMIRPLVPYALKGVLWYQGEADSRPERHPYYAAMLREMISDWRQNWQLPTLPFIIIQLPAYREGEGWVQIRKAQQDVSLEPHNSLVVTLDCGEEKNLHPPKKEPVGTRAANLALARQYKVSAPSLPPQVKSIASESGGIRVSFECEAATTLDFRAAPETGIQVAGSDRKYFPALARQEGNSLFVTSPSVAVPVSIRYACTAWTPVTIYDSNGLPAAQFSFQLPEHRAAKSP